LRQQQKMERFRLIFSYNFDTHVKNKKYIHS
jgi:hypothetical protein